MSSCPSIRFKTFLRASSWIDEIKGRFHTPIDDFFRVGIPYQRQITACIPVSIRPQGNMRYIAYPQLIDSSRDEVFDEVRIDREVVSGIGDRRLAHPGSDLQTIPVYYILEAVAPYRIIAAKRFPYMCQSFIPPIQGLRSIRGLVLCVGDIINVRLQR
jgi:hypothetical protein